MRHVTAIEKSLLIGDDAADTLTRYAAHLARLRSADTVDLHALGVDGNAVVATFLLNTGTVLMVETTESTLEEPDNADAVAYMIAQMSQYETNADSLGHVEPDDSH